LLGLGLLLLSVIALPAPASAHHILGIPHYKYGTDYPQIPFVEVQATVEQYDMAFTYFPGTPKPGEAVRFKLYVRNRDDATAFKEPLTVSIYQKTWIGDDKLLVEDLPITVGVGPEGNDYKFFYTFDDAEAYEVRLNFPGSNGPEHIPFPVGIGETDDRPLIAGAILLLLGAVVSVAVIKRRQKKRAKQRPAARTRVADEAAIDGGEVEALGSATASEDLESRRAS